MGVSVETDISDNHGLVVVEHDPPKDSAGSHNLLSAVLAISRDGEQTLALNIKADGLLGLLGDKARKSFFFDVSAAETVKFWRASATVAIRVSEHESIAEQFLESISFGSGWTLSRRSVSNQRYRCRFSWQVNGCCFSRTSWSQTSKDLELVNIPALEGK